MSSFGAAEDCNTTCSDTKTTETDESLITYLD